MAATILTRNQGAGPRGVTVMTAQGNDPTNGNRFISNGYEQVIARNTGAGANVIVVDHPDANVTNDSRSIPVGAEVLLGPWTSDWRDEAGYITITSSGVTADEVELLVIAGKAY